MEDKGNAQGRNVYNLLECVVITGAERYSKYTGYSYTFEWTADFQDEKPM